jgi:hypothetical protein
MRVPRYIEKLESKFGFWKPAIVSFCSFYLYAGISDEIAESLKDLFDTIFLAIFFVLIVPLLIASSKR